MKLTCSALKIHFEDSDEVIIICGKRHCDAYKKMHFMEIKSKYHVSKIVEGFFTNNNAFVNRYDAFKIAKAANQLLPEAKEKYKFSFRQELFSEDLW